MGGRYWVETLGCPKNKVDSDKLEGTLLADGLSPARRLGEADLVVVNTCAFIEEARQESVEAILDATSSRRGGARVVVTGCLAERYGEQVSRALPEVDLVAGFGVPVSLKNSTPHRSSEDAADGVPVLDLLNLPRPAPRSPWAYVKLAEGCDRRCGFCAIPQFRGRQRSRTEEAVLYEIESLIANGVKEIVLVAQDLASWGLDRDGAVRIVAENGSRPIVSMVRRVSALTNRVRLLYLYPSSLDDGLVEAIIATEVPYFDLSLQHVSRPLLKRMRRWGSGERFLERISGIRRLSADATLRSSFIIGYPGETEADHDMLLGFLEEAQLDWAGFFAFSQEENTFAAGLPEKVPRELAMERLRECSELQDEITSLKRSRLVGTLSDVLVDEPGVGRSVREAPEIDGVIHVPKNTLVGEIQPVELTSSAGPDLWGRPLGTRRGVTEPLPVEESLSR